MYFHTRAYIHCKPNCRTFICELAKLPLDTMWKDTEMTPLKNLEVYITRIAISNGFSCSIYIWKGVTH